jgi:hypothetical protein
MFTNKKVVLIFALQQILKPNAHETAQKNEKRLLFIIVLRNTLGFLSVLGDPVLSKRSKSLCPNVHVGIFSHSVYVYLT